MAKIVVPNTGAGFISPNEDLVGFQTTQGGGLTNTNLFGITELLKKLIKIINQEFFQTQLL